MRDDEIVPTGARDLCSRSLQNNFLRLQSVGNLQSRPSVGMNTVDRGVKLSIKLEDKELS